MGNSPVTSAHVSHTLSTKSSNSFDFKQSHKVYNEMLKEMRKLNLIIPHMYTPNRQTNILFNLPKELKPYSTAIQIVGDFWLSHMDKLCEKEVDEIAEVIYCKLFLKCKHIRSTLLIIPKHTNKIIKTFGYIIKNLIYCKEHTKLFKELATLGAMHQCHSNVITAEVYMELLEAWHFAMEEKFQNKYKNNVRFNFNQLYRLIVDTLMGRKIASSIQQQYAYGQLQSHHQIHRFLGSLEECLTDETGKICFKKYLEEQFCENYLFYEAVTKYKSFGMQQRIKCGRDILKTFIEIGATKEINISYGVRKIILCIVKLAKQMNDNREKYGDLLAHSRNNSASILNQKDILFINTSGKKCNNLRVDITKQLTFELEDILTASGSNLSADDVIYSMGFTETLFDAAYDEIFNLMTAKWIPFKHSILSYCGDSDLIKQQQQNDEKMRKEQRLTLNMVRAVNSISKSRRKHTAQNGDFKNILNMMKDSKNIKYRNQNDQKNNDDMVAIDDDDEEESDFDKNYDGFYDDAEDEDDDESEAMEHMHSGHHHVITPITPITPMTPEKCHMFFAKSRPKIKLMPNLKMIESEFSTEWSEKDLKFLDYDDEKVTEEQHETSKLSLISPVISKKPAISLQESATSNSIMLTLNPNLSNSSLSQRSDTATPVSFKSHGFSPTDLYSMVSHQFPHTGGGRISTSLSAKTRSGARSRSNSSISSNEATKRVITPQKYTSKLYGAHRKQMKVSG